MTMTIKLLLITLLLHFITDFTLQGCLADMKQKRWWDMLSKDVDSSKRRYEHDWICGLVCHALYWTLATFSPLLLTMENLWMIVFVVAANTAIHAIVDHLKCNRYVINLWQDQLLHLAQIVVTFLIWR